MKPLKLFEQLYLLCEWIKVKAPAATRHPFSVMPIAALLQGFAIAPTIPDQAEPLAFHQELTKPSADLVATRNRNIPWQHGQTTDTVIDQPPTHHSASKTVNKRMTDLELTKQTNKVWMAAGEAITFTIKVINKGPEKAKNVVVKNVLPDDITFQYAAANQGFYYAHKGLWEIGTLDSNKEAIITIAGKTIGKGHLVSSAQIISSNLSDPDSNPGYGMATEDDQSSISIEVLDGIVGQIERLKQQIRMLMQENKLHKESGKLLIEELKMAAKCIYKKDNDLAVLLLHSFIKKTEAQINEDYFSHRHMNTPMAAAQRIIEQLTSGQPVHPLSLSDTGQ